MTPLEVRNVIVQALRSEVASSNRSSLNARLADPEADVAFDELGVDSLGTIEVSLRVEDATGCPVDPGDLIVNQTVNTLAAFISRKLAEARTDAASA
jgi:acyl carrier protein